MRDIHEIATELFNHPDFVVGNFLTRSDVRDMNIDPNSLDEDVLDRSADYISDLMQQIVWENGTVVPAEA